ncbi:MAG: DUF2848 domain-containing protein [Silicimonas sp.]|nr:DUF2848 domain-containing protein [Silicimonas sp.]
MRFAADENEVEGRIGNLIVAGWTGRDASAVQHHIEELAAIGVAPPSEVPLFYRVSRTLLTQEAEIEVLGAGTSGEVEPLLVRLGGDLWLGLGSDHTDRDLEAISVAASKQACPKPVSGTLWRFDDVAARLDRMQLSCEIEEGGAWVRYQEGTLAAILPLGVLAERAKLGEGEAMLCGTLAAIGGVRPARAYRMSLSDPVYGRVIRLEYRVRTLPVVA